MAYYYHRLSHDLRVVLADVHGLIGNSGNAKQVVDSLSVPELDQLSQKLHHARAIIGLEILMAKVSQRKQPPGLLRGR